VIAGIDEAGRGPLAGPVVAAAVILGERHGITGLADSKTLSEVRREQLAEAIRSRARAWAVAEIDATDIDRINILQATLLAMQRAVADLAIRPALALVDGNQAPRLDCAVETIVKGDARIPEIAAASILAKVHRDNRMREIDARFPGYGFAAHKGYPTAAHVAALDRLGVSPVHRRSFGPVRRLLEAGPAD
jgi:ribonuclease HII